MGVDSIASQTPYKKLRLKHRKKALQKHPETREGCGIAASL